MEKEKKWEENRQGERIRCIDNNQEALIWRLRIIEMAKKEIILATFEAADDHGGRDIIAALFAAANRGVHVKLLIDGMNGSMHLKGNDRFRALFCHENVEVKFYNPVCLKRLFRVSYRMHDKYLVADDQVYILGGRNTNDLFLGDYREKYNIDRDILVYEGATPEDHSLWQIKRYFEQIWASRDSVQVCCRLSEKKRRAAERLLSEHYRGLLERYPEAFGETDWQAETMEAEGVCLLTNPMAAGKKQPTLWDAINQVMKMGSEIFICTPYIICDKKMYQDLTALCESGKQVQMMINAVENGANPWGCVDYRNQKKRIQQTGMEIFEYLGGQSLHTKTVLVDDDISIVGSLNCDMRSVYLDTELMLFIRSQELNAQLRQVVEEEKEKSRRVFPDGSKEDGKAYREVRMPWLKRLIYGCLRWIIRPFRRLL